MTTAAVFAPGVPVSAPPSAAPAVSASGVLRRFRNGRGVGPIDLEVAAGEVVAIMGRNGSGKTTLLRLLATVARPQSGTLRWFGGGAGRGRARLGLALDSALEDGGLTGRQATNFWCSQWVRGRAEAAALTDDALATFGLAAAADDPVGSYSFGMRRRLALAAAFAHAPALALLDEPTAGLDPEGAEQLASVLRRRCATGASTVVASNDAGFVEAVADRVAFLDDGLLLRCASPRAMLESLPRGRVAELVVAGLCNPAALAALPGVTEVAVDGSCATVRFEAEHDLAGIVAAADAPGGRLRELRLRRPDLADCFRQLTGRALEERP